MLTAHATNFVFSKQVESASNGLIAFEKFRKKFEKGETYTIILMDNNMPQMDGFESTKNIRKFVDDHGGQQPYIIGITGQSEPIYVEKGL